MKNILITSVGGDIGINIVNILIKQKLFKCNLIAVDVKEYVFSKKLVNKFYKVPRTEDINYLDKMDEIISLNNIDLIIPSSEKDILFYKSNKDYFNQKNIKLLINNDNLIDDFLDKEKTSLVLKKLGVNTPNTYNLDTYSYELQFPVIVKAKKSIISKTVRVIESKEELEYLKSVLFNKNEYIVQEYIGSANEEYTTAVYRSDKGTKSISFKRNLDGDKTGFAVIDNYKQLDNYSSLIAEYYNLNGSMNIQSRKQDSEFYVFEINPRISSTVYIRDHFNFSDLLWWICTLLNIKFTFNKIDKEGISVIGYTYNFY